MGGKPEDAGRKRRGATAEDYTLVTVGELTSQNTDFQVAPLVEDTSGTGGDQACLRAVHVAPDAGYVTVDSNDYTVQVRPDAMENDGEVVYNADGSLNGGTVYTVFASGYLSPGDDPVDESFEVTVENAST